MLQPESYPHPVNQPIQKIETHISSVYLTGTYAYKVKKPVNFGFVDFSTLEKRAYFCHQELTLNRRFAPKVYLDVVCITAGGIHKGGLPEFFKVAEFAPSKNLEFAVKMGQFDPKSVLSHLFAQKTPPTATQMRQLAQNIAQVHLQAEAVADTAPWGWPDKVAEPILDNFPVLEQTFPQWQTDLQRLKDWTQHTLSQLRPLLAKRRYQGHIRACHGDLHLDNIALIDQAATPFDGIEFNEQFRWIDPISDLAFLLMDLDFHQAPALRQAVLLQWLYETGDYAALPLLPFYLTYRALVRAKITTLRGQQLSGIAQQQCFETVRQYIELAQTYTQPHTPFLIVMQGVSGSGKSFYTHALAEKLGAVIISSDRERKRLAGMAPHQRPTDAEKAHLYSPDMNKQTYTRLYSLARQVLAAGMPVILDATFLKKAHRESALALAEGVPAFIFSIQADEARCAEQIAQRTAANTDPSDADESVMHHQLAFMDPPDPRAEPVFIQPAGEPVDWVSLQKWLPKPIKGV